MSNTIRRNTLHWLAERYEKPLRGAAIACNLKFADDRDLDSECYRQRDANEQGRYRRVAFTDELNRVFAGLDTVSDPNNKQLWLRILDGTYLLHIQVLPQGGLANLHTQLKIPKTVEQMATGQSEPDKFDLSATGQLSMLDRIEGSDDGMDGAPSAAFRPVALLYQMRSASLYALHLVEYRDTAIVGVESIQVVDDAGTGETHPLPPSPTPRLRYTEDEDEAEVSLPG